MSYDILIAGEETVDGWSICTRCLNVLRTPQKVKSRWGCDQYACDKHGNPHTALKGYLADHSALELESRLKEIMQVKGMKPAMRSIRVARLKCLIVLSQKVRGGAATAGPG
ncbi:MAG: hypothetical protein H6978_02575 [Gammaproteobacteria bacterium]|nr:hypothetical protein [Gammaproteobacteria bacterium]